MLNHELSRDIDRDVFLCQMIKRRTGIEILREEFDYETQLLNKDGLTKIQFHLKGRYSGEINFQYIREELIPLTVDYYGIALRYPPGAIQIRDLVEQLKVYLPEIDLDIEDIRSLYIKDIQASGHVEIDSPRYFSQIPVSLLEEEHYCFKDEIVPEVIIPPVPNDDLPIKTIQRVSDGDTVDYYAWPQYHKWRHRTEQIRDHILIHEPDTKQAELVEKIIDYYVSVLGYNKEDIPTELILTDFTLSD